RGDPRSLMSARFRPFVRESVSPSRLCRNTLFVPQIKSNRKIDNEDLRSAVFRLLHEPPTVHGINRTSWTMPLLSKILKDSGKQVGPALIRKMIKAAGYKWRKAKVVLTSSDPTYKQKLARIRTILSNLQPDEAFFRSMNTVLVRSRPNSDADWRR